MVLSVLVIGSLLDDRSNCPFYEFSKATPSVKRPACIRGLKYWIGQIRSIGTEVEAIRVRNFNLEFSITFC